MIKNPLETIGTMGSVQDLTDHILYMINHDEEILKVAFLRMQKVNDSSFQSKHTISEKSSEHNSNIGLKQEVIL
jgi:basic membrane lipoprotein Med (substrate-binding protein (PBP1-ABC) superfamily)